MQPPALLPLSGDHTHGQNVAAAGAAFLYTCRQLKPRQMYLLLALVLLACWQRITCS